MGNVLAWLGYGEVGPGRWTYRRGTATAEVTEAAGGWRVALVVGGREEWAEWPVARADLRGAATTTSATRRSAIASADECGPRDAFDHVPWLD